MKVNKDGDYVEPCMLVPVSDLIHLIEFRNMYTDGSGMSKGVVERWQTDYKELMDKAKEKLAHFNKHTIQQ